MNRTPQVFIVTEGGEQTGFGHLARCQSLYQAFAEININPTLLVNGDQSAADFCRDQPLRLMPWHNDQTELWRTIGKGDMVILDSLLAPEALFAQLAENIKVPVFLDDFIRRDHKKGLVIDWTVLADRKFYLKRHPHVVYLLGSHYTALRQDFWDTPTRPTTKTISNILVTFGGSDAANMTPRILRLLGQRYPKVTTKVVIGPGYSNLDEITQTMRPCHFIVNRPNAGQMKELMYHTDLAIAAGGQTLYELARMGVPTIALMVVDNQRDDISGWAEAGFIQYAGTPDDCTVEDKISNALDKLADYNTRLRCARLGQRYIDGKGARRIIAALKEKI
jgi:spore coat polysaccharide biosynthesis predicted glycosyltransferase SpsG